MENQNITYHICDKCQSLKVITTNSSTNILAKTINIPIDACNKCIKLGYEIYENSKSEKYTYLRDRTKDLYLSK